MIYKTLNVEEAWDIAQKFERDNFSYNGFYALFEAIEGMFEDNHEFDFIAWCCDFSEYKTAWEAMEQYQPEDMPTVDIEDIDGSGKDLIQIQEESEKLALEWLEEHTMVIPFDGGVIIQNF